MPVDEVSLNYKKSNNAQKRIRKFGEKIIILQESFA